MWIGGALIIGAGLMIALGARSAEPVVVTDIAIR